MRPILTLILLTAFTTIGWFLGEQPQPSPTPSPTPTLYAQDIFQFCTVREIDDAKLSRLFVERKNLAWSADGQNLAVRIDDTLEIWDVSSNELVRQLKVEEPDRYLTDFTWGRDSKEVAISTPLSVSIYDIGTGILTRQFEWEPLLDNQEAMYSIEWKPDENWIALQTPNEVMIWDIDTNTIIENIKIVANFNHVIAWSPNGDYLAFADGYTIKLWSIEEAKIEQELEIGNLADDLIWNPAGTELAVNVTVLGITIFDVRMGDKLAVISGISPLFWLDPDHFVTGYNFDGDPQSHLIVWNSQTWTEAGKLLLDDRVYSNPIALSPDGKTIAIPSKDDISLLEADCPSNP